MEILIPTLRLHPDDYSESVERYIDSEGRVVIKVERLSQQDSSDPQAALHLFNPYTGNLLSSYSIPARMNLWEWALTTLYASRCSHQWANMMLDHDVETRS